MRASGDLRSQRRIEVHEVEIGAKADSEMRQRSGRGLVSLRNTLFVIRP